jgi:hypothetical protein
MLNGVLLMFKILFFCRSIEMDNVKLPLVHDFFRIQSIRMVPLHKFKEIILNAQYKNYKNKIKKTWYNFRHEAFFSLCIR